MTKFTDALQAASFIGNITGAVSGNVTGNITGGNVIYPATVARTATALGDGAGIIAAAGMIQFVTVSATNAAHIIVLPPPVVGTIVILGEATTVGYELRTSDTATIALNGGTDTAAESAIAASTMVFVVCTTTTAWQGFSIVGTTFAGLDAAAN